MSIDECVARMRELASQAWTYDRAEFERRLDRIADAIEREHAADLATGLADGSAQSRDAQDT